MITPPKVFIERPPLASILVKDANTLHKLLPLLGMRIIALVLAWLEVNKTMEPTLESWQLNDDVMV